jgi:putative transposase
VKAGLAARAQDWPWSSTGALVAGRSTRHVDVTPALARTGDFAAFLAGGGDEARWRALLGAETVGRPVGAADWIVALEARAARPAKSGRRRAGGSLRSHRPVSAPFS